MRNKFFFMMLAGLVILPVGLWQFFSGNYPWGIGVMIVSSALIIFNWILCMILWLNPELKKARKG